MNIYPPKPPKKESWKILLYIIISLVGIIFAVGVLTMNNASAYATYKAGSLVVLGIACIVYILRRK